MSFDVLIAIFAVLVVGVAWLMLRKPKTRTHSKAKPASPIARADGPVSKPNSRGADSAELPVFEGAETQAAPAEPVHVPESLASFRLLLAADLDDVARAKIESICTSMPDPHPIHRQLAGGLDSPDQLAEAVSSDAGLTASILRTVNSAAFSLASPITSVHHAITYLGVSVVKGLVAQAAVSEQSDEGTPEQQLALSRIWTSACVASAMAQMLGQELGVPRPSVLATKSLFFNLGDVALTLSLPESPAWYQEGVSVVERINGQQSVCSANAAIVGANLARLWHLPDDIADAIESGFIPLATPPGEHPMSGDERRDNVLMYLAGRIGDRVTYRGVKDIAEIELMDTQEPGLFYLAGHLEAAGLGRVMALMQDPAFRRKANRVLSTLKA
jgi:hypothetical protein